MLITYLQKSDILAADISVAIIIKSHLHYLHTLSMLVFANVSRQIQHYTNLLYSTIYKCVGFMLTNT